MHGKNVHFLSIAYAVLCILLHAHILEVYCNISSVRLDELMMYAL